MGRRRAGPSLDELAAALERDPDAEYVEMDREGITRAEIDGAIKMFFIENDPVSAHLLASAASEVLRVLASEGQKLSRTEFRKAINDVLTPKEASEAHAILDLPYNFLKHGTPSRDQKVPIKLDWVMLNMLAVAEDFFTVFGYKTRSMGFLGAILAAARPSWSKDPIAVRAIAGSLELEGATHSELIEFAREQRKLLET